MKVWCVDFIRLLVSEGPCVQWQMTSGFIDVSKPSGCDVGTVTVMLINLRGSDRHSFSHFLASHRRCDIPSILHLLWRERTLAAGRAVNGSLGGHSSLAQHLLAYQPSTHN